MITAYIRSSSLGTLKMCEMQYYISYVLGIEQRANHRAELGTIFHKVMECLALCKKRQQESHNEIIVDDAVGQISPTFDYESESGVIELFDKAYEFYSKRSTHEYKKAHYKEIKTWLDDTLSYMGGIYDPRRREIYEAERHFDIEIDKPWATYEHELNGEKFAGKLRIKGTIDLILSIDQNTLEVCDWKTGQRKDWATGKAKEYADFQKDSQLMLYYYAIKKLYPDKNVVFTIYWARDGGPFTLCFDDSDMLKVEENLKEKSAYIWSCTQPKMLHSKQTDFRCYRLCHYCKNNWPGTSVNICNYVNQHIKKNGIQNTTDELMAEGFNPGIYKAPGE